MLNDRSTTSRREAAPKPTWAQSRQGFKHQLVIALVDEGFSFREADQIISAVFESMKEALLRHEPVDLPFGTLRVIETERTRGWRFGKVVRFRAFKVVLDTSPV